MKLFGLFKKILSFSLIDCDYAPSNMPEQLPIEFTIMRTIHGSDRLDYAIAICKVLLYYDGQAIKCLVLAPRFSGEHISENTQEIILGVAYVTDDSLIKGKTLLFEKCKYVAVSCLCGRTHPALCLCLLPCLWC